VFLSELTELTSFFDFETGKQGVVACQICNKYDFYSMISSIKLYAGK
jgi:hypothetical protein